MPRLCPWSSRRPRFSPFCVTISLLTLCNLLGLIAFHRWELVSNAPLGTSWNTSRRDTPSSPALGDASESTTLPQSHHAIGVRRPAGDVHILDVLINRTPFHFDANDFVADASKRYRISRNVLLPEPGLAKDSVVCLATQGSVGRLYWLVLLADLWDAPVSVAVFVFTKLELDVAKAYLALLRSCSDGIRRNFKFHIVYPGDEDLSEATKPPDWSRFLKERVSCSNHAAVLGNLLQPTKRRVVNSRQKLLYPQNHLRNVARDGCEQDFFFLTDIDVMPKPGLASDLDLFLRNRPRCRKCVYVVPTYESSKATAVPKSKSDLLRMVRKQQARPFHQKVFIHNQYATNHREWERMAPPASQPLSVAYRVRNYEFFYEPFYVAPKEVPRHDERFVGYGFTRNTQVYETYLAGFEFWVLDNAFAMHQGMENRRARDYWREKQNANNRKQFLLFKKDMKRRYSTSTIPSTTSSKPSSSSSSPSPEEHRQTGIVLQVR